MSSIAAESHGRDMAKAIFIDNQEDIDKFKNKHPTKEPGPHDYRRTIPEKTVLRQRLEAVSFANNLIVTVFL
jgi:ribosomal protein S4E